MTARTQRGPAVTTRSPSGRPSPWRRRSKGAPLEGAVEGRHGGHPLPPIRERPTRVVQHSRRERVFATSFGLIASLHCGHWPHTCCATLGSTGRWQSSRQPIIAASFHFFFFFRFLSFNKVTQKVTAVTLPAIVIYTWGLPTNKPVIVSPCCGSAPQFSFLCVVACVECSILVFYESPT